VLALDVTDLPELVGIERTAEGLRIGAATRLADIAASDLLSGVWRVLALGAGQVGSPQIRNLATIGGNVCNASPAADTIPCLLILDAQAEAISPRGHRRLPVAELFVGPGKTVLANDELLGALILPNPLPGALATYIKHSPRRAMDLAVVGVGVLLARARAGGPIEARIALGAVAPTPVRATGAESFLREAAHLDKAAIEQAALLAAQAIVPISDVRASAEYRTEMVRALTARALHQLSANL
jgi:carbon-monoxide dehydrogenase medium subunit